ncbi:SDR family NAD(P)-dependent oxidoreductase [Endozoicomonas sp. G2_1]|uniref:SDR family NAD(P)-dependent oxidoreductase n=1 Tax=Endozoicomonas sp. G2_1 TaxID=2821091 RepID=UPI001ADA4447|nr:SDR family NAD(P)-dependent oxidoreductase [Endozoicomonas sp. G2_1]MBO9491177.1 SDR family NAD(P)-dependent oxidoreductase [Endozoicomonas sp. G2_1]
MSTVSASSKPCVMITGASSGIGKALALHYAANNYQVIACGRNQDRLAELENKSANITTASFDVTDKQALYEHADNCQTTPDIIILNAGDCEYIDDARHFDGDLFERVIQINLIAIGHLIATWLPKLKPGSQLVLVGSSVTLLPLSRAEAYGASKAALAYLAQTLSIDLYDKSIDISLVSPGFVKTPLTDKNDFPMPFLLTPEQAAQRIAAGVSKRQFNIVFPKRLTWLLRLFNALPFSWWRKISQKLRQEPQHSKSTISN